MSLQNTVMGLGLRTLTYASQLPILDRPEIRNRVSGFLYGASRSSFAAIGMTGQQFVAVKRLARPARLPAGEAPELFDLTPSEDQDMLVDAAQDFAAGALRPAASDSDQAAAIDDELYGQAAELGLAMLNVPEELGGVATQRSAVTNVLVAEALAHGDMGLTCALLAGPSVALALAQWGDAEQQATYLPSLLEDTPARATLACMEGGALFDPFDLSVTATADGDGYILNGDKQMVIDGEKADLFIVAAATDDGPALFIVEASDGGISAAPQPAMGLRAAGTARLRFEGTHLPAGRRLDADYAAFVARGRLAASALAVGTSKAVMDEAAEYVNEREAFGEPISHRQAVAFKLSDMSIESDGMRLALWRAASLADTGKPFAREAARAHDLAGRHGMQIGSDGVQVHGGHGFTHEYPVERWYRDLRAVSLLQGAVIV